MILEKLIQEEKEAEEMLFGKSEENLEQAESTLVPEEIKQPEVIEQKPEPVEDWKKRFTNFKATADNTIYQLRKDNASLKSEIATLSEKNNSVTQELVSIKKQIQSKQKEESYNELFTQEDRDILGSEAIDIFKKAVKKVAPPEENEELKALKEELNIIKQDKIKRLKREKESVEEESFAKLRAKLSDLVSDWEQIDVDPKFIAFLDELDEIDLVPRKELFSNAVNNRSVRGVASFYESYKNQRSPSKEEILSKKITPVGTKGESIDMDNNNNETFNINDYDKFMDDFARGKYKGKEKEAKIIEARYDRAFMEGRMVD